MRRPAVPTALLLILALACAGPGRSSPAGDPAGEPDGPGDVAPDLADVPAEPGAPADPGPDDTPAPDDAPAPDDPGTDAVPPLASCAVPGLFGVPEGAACTGPLDCPSWDLCCGFALGSRRCTCAGGVVACTPDAPLPCETPACRPLAACDGSVPCPAGLECRRVPTVAAEVWYACLPAPVRLGVVADTHLVADLENDDTKRWIGAMDAFAAHDPPLDLVFSGGDNVEDLFCPVEFAEAALAGGEPVPIVAFYRDLVAAHAKVPFRNVHGNHDNRFFNTFLGKAVPLALWHEAFAGTGVFPAPWYAVEQGGWQFLVLDSTDLATNHEDNDLPTVGPEQLAWLEARLATGVPAVLFWHHWIAPPVDGEPLHPLMAAIRARKDVVRATFTGHSHVFQRYEWEGVKFYQTAQLRDSEPLAFHVVECDPVTREVRILNEAAITYLPVDAPGV